MQVESAVMIWSISAVIYGVFGVRSHDQMRPPSLVHAVHAQSGSLPNDRAFLLASVMASWVTLIACVLCADAHLAAQRVAIAFAIRAVSVARR